MENEFVAILNRLINQAKLGTSENKNRISSGSRNRLFQIAKNFSFSFFPPFFFFFSSFFPSPRVLLKPCGGPQFSREARTFRLFHVRLSIPRLQDRQKFPLWAETVRNHPVGFPRHALHDHFRAL